MKRTCSTTKTPLQEISRLASQTRSCRDREPLRWFKSTSTSLPTTVIGSAQVSSGRGRLAARKLLIKVSVDNRTNNTSLATPNSCELPLHTEKVSCLLLGYWRTVVEPSEARR
ncbi:hypothetical protein VTO42DRAFT_2376 [Malbranchea cinnamomea]